MTVLLFHICSTSADTPICFSLFPLPATDLDAVIDSLCCTVSVFSSDGQDISHGPNVMTWSTIASPLLYKMDYKDGGLVIQNEGYYYVYSKVFFLDKNFFQHSVVLCTEKYSGKAIPLLMSEHLAPKSREAWSNSYLGGVFHLDKDSVLLVNVSNTNKLKRHRSFENIFGAYMI